MDVSDSMAPVAEALTPGGMASVYIEREEALAHDADGAAVLFSNISDDAAERRDFWRLVEKYERSPSRDKMELLMKGHETFWRKVAEDPDCPADVRAALAKAEPLLTTEITTRDNQLIRAIMKRYGWKPPEKRAAAETDEQRGAREEREVASSFGAKFHDGRGGRVQFRIVGELPFDVDHQARVRILEGFADEFENRGLPYIAVMHAPDHTNDERNWHFHLVYHDRPARRFTGRREDHLHELPDRASKAAKSSHAIAERAFESNLTKWHSRWDFEVEVEYEQKDGRKKKARPFVQNKDRDCNHRDFVPKLRRKLASLTNVELEKAGLARRLDPRRHEAMAIDKKPDVHLGTQASRLENLGIPTSSGLQNERNEWERLQALAEDQRRAAEEQVDQQLLSWRKQFGEVRIEDQQQKLVDQALDDWKRASLIAAEHAYIARSIKQHYERMQSRALKVKRVTERHLIAITERRANARQTADRAGYEAKLEQANIYLAGLEVLMAQEIAQIANSEHFAKRYGDDAQRLSDQIGNALDRCRKQQADRARVSEPEAADLSIKAAKVASGVREGTRTEETRSPREGERRRPDAPSARPSQTQVRDAKVIVAILNEYLRPAHKKVGEALVLSFASADADLFQLDQETIIRDPRSIQRIEGAIQANERAMARVLAYIRAHPHRVEGPDGHQLLALASNAPRELREIASNFRRDPELRHALHDAASLNEDALASYRQATPRSTSEASKSTMSPGSSGAGKSHVQRAGNEIASDPSPKGAGRDGAPHPTTSRIVAKPNTPPVTNAAREPDGEPSAPQPQPASARLTSSQTNRDTVSQKTREADATEQAQKKVSDWQKAVAERSPDANRLAYLVRTNAEALRHAEAVLRREEIVDLKTGAAAHRQQMETQRDFQQRSMGF